MDYMEEALKEAYDGIEKKHGGPFGSVIVREGKILGRGHNRVLLKHDPTCHGEMEAIRDACQTLGNHDLSGCELYTTAYPCPMCLGAILWANISRVYFGCNSKDTNELGFRDDMFYQYLRGEKTPMEETPMEFVEYHREACLKLFQVYQSDMGNKRY